MILRAWVCVGVHGNAMEFVNQAEYDGTIYIPRLSQTEIPIFRSFDMSFSFACVAAINETINYYSRLVEVTLWCQYRFLSYMCALELLRHLTRFIKTLHVHINIFDKETVCISMSPVIFESADYVLTTIIYCLPRMIECTVRTQCWCIQAWRSVCTSHTSHWW